MILGNDPKFSEAMVQLEDKAEYAPVLIFSRYTDTLDGFLEFLGI